MSLFSAMIIEDDPMQRALLTLMLTPISTQVTAVASSEEALPLLAEKTPTVIFLDIVLPGMNGLEILHSIRANKRFEHTKIFVITAVPGRVTASDRALVEKVINKPFLITQVRQALREIFPAEDSPHSLS